MKTSPAGIALIKEFESCSLEAYEDGAGVWTIGVGHTSGVVAGDTCTQEEADAFLISDLGTAETCIGKAVIIPLTQNQFDACASFTFNLGCGSFRSSTLLKLLNAGSYELAAQEFPKWNHVAGQVSDGLTRRRLAEQALFLTPQSVVT